MSVLPLLARMRRKTVIAVRRVSYVRGGKVIGPEGALELTFDDRTSVVLDAGGDGESLAVSRGPWIDHFVEPLSDENRAFVERSGCWRAVPVSTEQALGRAVGQNVAGVQEITNSPGTVTGVIIAFASTTIRAEVDSDELVVDVV